MARGYGSFSIAVSNMERKRRRQNKRAEEIKAMQRDKYMEDRMNSSNYNEDIFLYFLIILILAVFVMILISHPILIAIGMIIGFFIALFH